MRDPAYQQAIVRSGVSFIQHDQTLFLLARGYAVSERIITDLGHDDVIVCLRCAADAFKGETLVVGILSADLDRPIRAFQNGVVETHGVLPDLRGIAVAGGSGRIL